MIENIVTPAYFSGELHVRSGTLPGQNFACSKQEPQGTVKYSTNIQTSRNLQNLCRPPSLVSRRRLH